MSEKSIHKYEGLWWFWDETSNRQGPFDSKEEAKRGLNKYIKWLKRKTKTCPKADSKIKAQTNSKEKGDMIMKDESRKTVGATIDKVLWKKLKATAMLKGVNTGVLLDKAILSYLKISDRKRGKQN